MEVGVHDDGRGTRDLGGGSFTFLIAQFSVDVQDHHEGLDVHEGFEGRR